MTLTACAQSPDDQETRDADLHVDSNGRCYQSVEGGQSADVANSDLDSNPVTSDAEAMDEFGDYDEEYDEDLAAVLEEVEQGGG